MSRKPRQAKPAPQAQVAKPIEIPMEENLTPAPAPVEQPKETPAPQAQVEVPGTNDQVSAMQAEIDKLRAEAAENALKLAEANKASQAQASKPRKALPDLSENGKMFGNKDEKKQFEFPIGWAGSVVVSQFIVEKLSTGNEVVNEATRRLMPYEPFVFDRLEKDQGFGEHQYIVLHDPR